MSYKTLDATLSCWALMENLIRDQSPDMSCIKGVLKSLAICDSYIFWVFFRQGIILPIFITVGYAWTFLGSGGEWVGGFAPPPSFFEQPQKGPSWIRLTTSRLNMQELFNNVFLENSLNFLLTLFYKREEGGLDSC